MDTGGLTGLELGLYEELITLRVARRVEEWQRQGAVVQEGSVGADSAPHVLARHVGATVRRVLEGLPAVERVHAANHILESVATIEGAREWVDLVDDGPRQLLAVAEAESADRYRVRPATPLSESALLTNAPEDPSLGFELRAEIATADRIDLLCAFVKWHGLRVLEGPLQAARARGVPIRVLTSTYIGATERAALDRLVRDFGAEVKVNYEVRSTRLHAKAWLFRRGSGYDTAYVGSSNLSKAALLDGLEWNVRLSSVETPAVLQKFEATFDSYWSDPAFENYDPDADGLRLDRALDQAAGRTHGGPVAALTLSGLEVTPYPHQRDMLERLRVEREVRGHHRNLLVAATGTGKTVMAALDYRALRRSAGHDLKLLFVAHRREILDQSLRTYQDVLVDANFGERLHSGEIPDAWTHVFASVQSLHPRNLARLAPEHFDVIVIDEFHHGTAPTYRRILDHFRPKELLGLTATPERTDGRTIQGEFFGGRIAAELRLWEALENDLLSPFHYFGISDSTDLRQVAWKAGSYDIDGLSNLLSGNEARARLVVDALRRQVADPGRMRALGFCVSVAHARFMARYFRQAGLNAIALSAESSREERAQGLTDLRSGAVQVIFSKDLFNEGLDIPDVDTLLLLRPTASATVFLQQLGRGLRRTPDKAVLTVLDFIGQHRKEFRFENQFRALTDLTRTRLLENLEADFPTLPAGCQIVLERKAKERILDNIRDQLRVDVTVLAREVAACGERELSRYLAESGREAKEVYKGARNSWTGLLRRSGLLTDAAPEDEPALLARMSAFLHVDDRERIDAYTRLVSDDGPGYDELSPREQAYARMLFFNFWDKAGGFAGYQDGLNALRRQPAVRSELRQLLAHCLETAEHYPIPLAGPHASLPLKVHAAYNRSEILAAMGIAGFGRQMPGSFAQGAVEAKEFATDVLLITLEKDDKDFSPTVRYKDFALSPTLFHWETQSTTAADSPTGRRYREHDARGSHVLLFVRRYKNTDTGSPAPWMLLGPAHYSTHRGSRPMAVEWRLEHPMPADMWVTTAIAPAS